MNDEIIKELEDAKDKVEIDRQEAVKESTKELDDIVEEMFLGTHPPRLEIFYCLPTAMISRPQTKGSACFDIHACLQKSGHIDAFDQHNQLQLVPVINESLEIHPKWRYLIPTGCIFNIPEGYSVRIHPRSGLAIKFGLTLINCEGVIDSDYVEQVMITLVNFSEETTVIQHTERLCQGELVEQLVYSMSNTLRKPEQKTDRVGGFGSTGK